MLYFFIVPAFLAWLVVATIAVVLVKFVQPLRPAFPYVWRICLHATLGFLVANGMFVLALSLGVVAMQEATFAPNGGGVPGAIFGVSAILGPLLASAIGWLGGSVAGLVFARGKKQHV